MSTVYVSNADQLASALNSAKAGDVISLAAGYYGNISLSGKAFSDEVVIKSDDPDNPASFGSLSIKASQNITFSGVNVDFVPNESTVSFSSAVLVENSNDITFKGGVIEGGPAVTGVSIDADKVDSTGNVIGLPTGRGVTIQGSSNVTIAQSDISHFLRGIAIGDSEKVTITDNEIHHLRKTAIVGGGDDLVIEGNYLHSSSPWKIGTAGGDHADFIALWTDPNQGAPTTNVTIRDNILAQGDGTGVLGMWLQGDVAGFANVVIEGNAILGGDTQGIMMSNTVGGSVKDNVLIQTTEYAKAPGIILLEGATNISVSENIASAIGDKNGGVTGNTIYDNWIAQKLSTLKVGYYDSQDIASKLLGLTDATDIYNVMAKLLGAPLNDVAVVGPAPVPLPAPEPEAPVGPLPPAIDMPEAEAPAPEPVVGDLIIGRSAADYLEGGAGNDTIDGRGGADQLLGGAGDDTYIVPNSQAYIIEDIGGGLDTVIARGDYILGQNLENLVISTSAKNSWSATGNELSNVISGNEGSNLIDGRGGDDTICGGAGNDIIIGGAGEDQLTGGAGADVFRFGQGSGHDVVTDFGVGGRDVLDLSAYLKAGIKAYVEVVDDGTMIKLTTGDTITLTGVDPSHLKVDGVGFIHT